MHTPKALDPADDVSGEMFKQDLGYFRDVGVWHLFRDMFKQTVKDIIKVRADKHAPASVATSASWFRREDGKGVLEFLMPDFPAQKFIAVLYQNPEMVLEKMEHSDKKDAESGNHNEKVKLFGLDGDLAELVFRQSAEDNEASQVEDLQDVFGGQLDQTPGPVWG